MAYVETNQQILRQNLSKRNLTRDEEVTLKDAGVAFIEKKYQSAIVQYKKFIQLNNNNNEQLYNEPSKLLIVINYLTSKCLLESREFKDLLEAKAILSELEETVGNIYPMLYYGFAKLYVTLYCFKEAEKMILKGFSVLKDGDNFEEFYIPEHDVVIPESIVHKLKLLLLNIKGQCDGWHPPDAKCFMNNCIDISQNNISGKNIFFKSPAFNGYVKVSCNNIINPCTVSFHVGCWKNKKELLSSGSSSKLSDKDLLNLNCFTPNCEYDNSPCLINKICLYGDDAKLKTTTENTIDKSIWQSHQQHHQQLISKGAIRKQQQRPKNNNQTIKTPKSKSLTMCNKKKMINNYHKLEKENNENDYEESDGLTIKVEVPLKENSWTELMEKIMKNRSKQRRGLLELKEKEEEVVEENFNENSSGGGGGGDDNNEVLVEPDDKLPDLEQLKTFLFTWFVECLTENGPMISDVLMEKWGEAMDMIGKSSELLTELDDVGKIKGFLRQSSSIITYEEYICTVQNVAEAIVMTRKISSYDTDHFSYDDSICSENENDRVEEDAEVDEENHQSVVNLFNLDESKNEETMDVEIDKISSDEIEFKVHENEKENIEDNQTLEILTGSENIATLESEVQATDKICQTIETSHDYLIMKDKLHKLENEKLEWSICNEELETAKNLSKSQKLFAIQNNLLNQYIANKKYIDFKLDKLNFEYSIVMKLQEIFKKTLRHDMLINCREWYDPINEINKISDKLDREYSELTASTKLKNFNINEKDMNLTIKNFPSLPRKDIPELIQNTFNMCLNELNKNNQMVVDNFNKKYQSIIEDLNKNRQVIIDDFNSNRQKTVDEMNRNHQRTIDEMNTNHQKTIDELNKNHQIMMDQKIRQLQSQIQVSHGDLMQQQQKWYGPRPQQYMTGLVGINTPTIQQTQQHWQYWSSNFNNYPRLTSPPGIGQPQHLRQQSVPQPPPPPPPPLPPPPQITYVGQPQMQLSINKYPVHPAAYYAPQYSRYFPTPVASTVTHSPAAAASTVRTDSPPSPRLKPSIVDPTTGKEIDLTKVQANSEISTTPDNSPPERELNSTPTPDELVDINTTNKSSSSSSDLPKDCSIQDLAENNRVVATMVIDHLIKHFFKDDLKPLSNVLRKPDNELVQSNNNEEINCQLKENKEEEKHDLLESLVNADNDRTSSPNAQFNNTIIHDDTNDYHLEKKTVDFLEEDNGGSQSSISISIASTNCDASSEKSPTDESHSDQTGPFTTPPATTTATLTQSNSSPIYYNAEEKNYTSDKLIEIIRDKYPGVLEYDIFSCVEKIRQKYNGSLTGITLGSILNEVDNVICDRQKFQLCDYRSIIEEEENITNDTIKELDNSQSANMIVKPLTNGDSREKFTTIASFWDNDLPLPLSSSSKEPTTEPPSFLAPGSSTSQQLVSEIKKITEQSHPVSLGKYFWNSNVSSGAFSNLTSSIPAVADPIPPPPGLIQQPKTLIQQSDNLNQQQSSNEMKRKLDDPPRQPTPLSETDPYWDYSGQSDSSTRPSSASQSYASSLKSHLFFNDTTKQQNITKKYPSSGDKLFNYLHEYYPEVLEYDLVVAVEAVRRNYNGSLSGKPFSKILRDIDRNIIHREKAQIIGYTVGQMAPKRQRTNSTSSILGESCAPSQRREPYHAIMNPWGKPKQAEWKEATDECVICMESLSTKNSNDKKNTCELIPCLHTFHRQCIEYWYRQNKTCPTCRLDSTLDEFPPLA